MHNKNRWGLDSWGDASCHRLRPTPISNATREALQHVLIRKSGTKLQRGRNAWCHGMRSNTTLRISWKFHRWQLYTAQIAYILLGTGFVFQATACTGQGDCLSNWYNRKMGIKGCNQPTGSLSQVHHTRICGGWGWCKNSNGKVGYSRWLLAAILPTGWRVELRVCAPARGGQAHEAGGVHTASDGMDGVATRFLSSIEDHSRCHCWLHRDTNWLAPAAQVWQMGHWEQGKCC